MTQLRTALKPCAYALLLAGIFAGFFCERASAQTLQTLAGGRLSAEGADAGFVDGDSLQSAQFNEPFGLALDAEGNLLVADAANGALRLLQFDRDRVTTPVLGLARPVDVSVDADGDVFILDQGEGTADGGVIRYDRFDELFEFPELVTGGLEQPTAMTLDTNSHLLVTERVGRLKQIDVTDGSVSILASDLNQPYGVARLQSGLIAVSDTGNHQIRFLNPETGATVERIGVGIAGFRNGESDIARFNRPHQLAVAPNGSLVVADRLNHRVRLVSVDGLVTTLYGIDPSQWEGPFLNADPIILPGWFDGIGGDAETAEAREPVGVVVAENGDVYTSEVFYHLIRQVTNTGLTENGDGNGNGGRLVVQPPAFSPQSGYYPLGRSITVTNFNTNAFLPTRIFYTRDGSEPTTNSFELALTDQVGTISWQETTRDLTSLRLKAFVGTNSSQTVSGLPVATNQIGVTGDLAGGIGSTLIVPITVSLQPETELRSLGVVVEVSPLSAGAPPIPDEYRALPINAEDAFIPLAGPAPDGEIATFNALRQRVGDTQRLGIAYVSTNSNFEVANFGTVALLAVPIPDQASEGDRYRLVVKDASASNAENADIDLLVSPPREILVRNSSYLVGDSAATGWYQAGGFGDGRIRISDANNAFIASLGLREPFPFSDLFDAMDAFPLDSPGVAGGDGLIRFLDWQTILFRSLNLEDGKWLRSRTDGGDRIALADTPNGAANQPASALSETPGAVWHPEAGLRAQTVENAEPGATVRVPVHVRVAEGAALSGLQFLATISGPVALDENARFIPAATLPEITYPPAPLAVNQAGGAWNLFAFEPALQQDNYLGDLTFEIPESAQAGQVYSVRFTAADGAPNLQTVYQLETHPAEIWIGTTAQRPAEVISDEWKTTFFGDTAHLSAQPEADPDADGVPNLQEYQAGTDPTDRLSRLHLQTPEKHPVENGMVLRWLSAPGKRYRLESASSLNPTQWEELTTRTGDGQFQEYVDTQTPSQVRFYRIRLEP